jgi:hypothetical protein
MTTARVSRRRAYGMRGSIRMSPAILAGVLLACVAVFAGFFAVGRALSPRPVPREAAPANLTRVSAGAVIPLALAESPSIDLRVPPRHAVAPPSQVVTPAPAVTSTPAPIVVTPPVESVPPPVITPTPAPTVHHESPPVTGKSFDSSG